MIRIAEKLVFMKSRAVKVCAKSGVGRKTGRKNGPFVRICWKTASEKKILDSSDRLL